MRTKVKWLPPEPGTGAAFTAGQDYARNGENETNCHVRHFVTREQTKAWQRGRDSIIPSRTKR